LATAKKQTRKQKEASTSMREEYNRLVDFTVSRIVDRESDRDDSLERSIACFWLVIRNPEERDRGRGVAAKVGRAAASKQPKKLLSFAWIAATTCLTEVDKFQRSIGF